MQSSLSQNGGADLRSPCSGKFLKALKWWVKLPQLFPEIFGFAQRPIWWAAGRERQSPPSSLAGRRATEWQSALASVFVLITTFIFPDFCKIIFLPHLDLHCTALSILLLETPCSLVGPLVRWLVTFFTPHLKGLLYFSNLANSISPKLQGVFLSA